MAVSFVILVLSHSGSFYKLLDAGRNWSVESRKSCSYSSYVPSHVFCVIGDVDPKQPQSTSKQVPCMSL